MTWYGVKCGAIKKLNDVLATHYKLSKICCILASDVNFSSGFVNRILCLEIKSTQAAYGSDEHGFCGKNA